MFGHLRANVPVRLGRLGHPIRVTLSKVAELDGLGRLGGVFETGDLSVRPGDALPAVDDGRLGLLPRALAVSINLHARVGVVVGTSPVALLVAVDLHLARGAFARFRVHEATGLGEETSALLERGRVVACFGELASHVAESARLDCSRETEGQQGTMTREGKRSTLAGDDGPILQLVLHLVVETDERLLVADRLGGRADRVVVRVLEQLKISE